MREELKNNDMVGEVWDTFNEDQKLLVYFIAGTFVEEKVVKLTQENERLKAKIDLLNARLDRQKRKYEKKLDNIVKLCDSAHTKEE